VRSSVWPSNSHSRLDDVARQGIGPDLEFATAEVTKSTAEGLKSSSDGPLAASSAEEKQSA
jgi:hypothetical protein